MYSAGHSGLRDKSCFAASVILPHSATVTTYFNCCRVMFILLRLHIKILFYILNVLHRLSHLETITVYLVLLYTDNLSQYLTQQLSEHKRNDNKHHIPQQLVIPHPAIIITQIKCMATTATANTDARSCKKLAT